MKYAIEVNNICKEYGERRVLNNLSMKVLKGSIYGFVGKNGVGKTTTIRVLCGLQYPSKGKFTINGFSSEEEKDITGVGAIIDTPALYLDSSARRNIELQYDLLGIKDKGDIDKLLKLVGLNETGRLIVKKFSLGMKQRLAIAVALVGNPDILILDELINGLDPEGIIEIRKLIQKLNKEKGITFLISSHYLDELSKIATHYGFIKNGKIIEEVSREELDNRLNKSIKIVTDKSLKKYLKTSKYDYKLISDNEALLFGNININKLVIGLDKNKINIVSINSVEEDLEEYFLNLIGVDSND